MTNTVRNGVIFDLDGILVDAGVGWFPLFAEPGLVI